MTRRPIPSRGPPWYIGLAYGSIAGFLVGFTLAGTAILALSW